MLEGLRILAVHHDAGNNGATLLFQSVLEGLVRDHGATIATSLPREGPIMARCQALGPVQLRSSRRRSKSRIGRAADRLRRRPSPARAIGYDVIFANSAGSLRDVERLLPDDDTPLVVYIHESRYMLRNADDFAATVRVLPRATLILAASPGVRDALEQLVRPAARIVVVRPFIPVRPVPKRSAELASDAPRLNPDATIIGTVGTMSWYKGTDLFVLVAHRVSQLLPDHSVEFVWVGNEWRPGVRHQVEHDVEVAGLEQVVKLPGEVDDPTDFLRSLTLFLLPSREDSWPLVMLEAAAEGVPTVCFQKAGGAEEFVASGGGIAVPYLDVEGMAHAIARYLSDPQLLSRDRRIARESAMSVTAEEQVRTIADELAALPAEARRR